MRYITLALILASMFACLKADSKNDMPTKNAMSATKTTDSIESTESIKVVVSVLPLKEMIERIGGKYVEVEVLVPAGKSPEIYEPSIAQMKHITNAHIFFGVGMPFETTWHKRFVSTNPKLIYHLLSSRGIEAHSNNAHIHNPHIWLSSKSIKPHIIKIAKALSAIKPKYRESFHNAANELTLELQSISEKTQALFANAKAQRHFLVYHSAFSVFANDFSIYEHSIEKDGKETKVKELNALLNEITSLGIQAIFIQPQFSPSRVQFIAKSANLRIIELDPLNAMWLSSLQTNACQIAFNLSLNEVKSCLELYFKE